MATYILFRHRRPSLFTQYYKSPEPKVQKYQKNMLLEYYGNATDLES